MKVRCIVSKGRDYDFKACVGAGGGEGTAQPAPFRTAVAALRWFDSENRKKK